MPYACPKYVSYAYALCVRIIYTVYICPLILHYPIYTPKAEFQKRKTALYNEFTENRIIQLKFHAYRLGKAPCSK